MAKGKTKKPSWLAWLEYVPARLILPLVRWLPYRAGGALARGTGGLLYYLLPTYRKVALINLAIAFQGTLEPKHAARVARNCFAGLVQTLFEFVLLTRLDREAVTRHTLSPSGYEDYKAAVARGKGVIACSIHLSNWYWTVVCAALDGHRVNVVVRPLDNPLLDEEMRKAFARWGIRVISRRRVFPAAVAALRRGETVALMVDQNAAAGGRFVPFFGVAAATMGGLFHLWRGTGATLLCVHDEREGNAHRAVMKELTALPDDEITCLGLVNRYFEDVVAARPEQYLWLHPRWKTRPSGEATLYPNLRV